MRYRLNRFSVERLMDFLTRLGKDVEIRIAGWCDCSGRLGAARGVLEFLGRLREEKSAE